MEGPGLDRLSLAPHSHQPWRAFLAQTGKLGSREEKGSPALPPGLFLSPPITFLHNPTQGSGEKAAPDLCPWDGALGGRWGPLPETYRQKERGEEINHGLHVEPPFGSDADRGEEGQAADCGQEQFSHERPHGLGRRGGVPAAGVPRAGRREGDGLLLPVGAPVAAAA